MKMFDSMNSGIASRMTALAIALVFCIGMFSPMVAVAGTAEAPAIEARQMTSLLENEPPESLAAEPQPEVLAAPEPVEPNTIIIQPNETVGKDTVITTQVPFNENSFGNWDRTLVGNGSHDFRGLLEFDIPSTLTSIKSATLSAYHFIQTGANVNVSVHGVSSAWSQGNGNTNMGVSGSAANWSHSFGYSTDFELDNGGLTGTNDWVRGILGPWVGADPQSIPPTTAHSGTYMWGTVMNSEYSNLGGWSNLSLSIDLTSASGNPTLSFWDWYDVFEPFDHGEVYVNGVMVLDRATAYVPVTAWEQHSISLSPYIGNIANIQFSLYTSTVIARAGWYIDDIQISQYSQPWTTPGGDYYSTPSSYQTIPNVIGWFSWNVTDIVQNWASGTWENNGFIMVGDNPNPVAFNIAWFYTSDYTDALYRPKLTISYAAEITNPVPAQVFSEDDAMRSIPLSGRGAGSVQSESATGGSDNSWPFGGASGLGQEFHYQVLYNSTQVGAEGVISRISFKRTQMDVGNFSNFRIGLGHTSLTNLDITFANNYHGFLIEVFKADNVILNSSNNDPWIHFDLNGNFTYDSAYNLLVDISWVGDGGVSVRTANVGMPGFKRAWIWDTTAADASNRDGTQPVIRFLVDAVNNAGVLLVADQVREAESAKMAWNP